MIVEYAPGMTARRPDRLPSEPKQQDVSSDIKQHDGPPTTAQINAAVMSFALLADPTRVRMLWALRDQDLDVSSLAEIAGCRPTVASQHLSKLRFAGLVEGTRQGRRIVYRLRGGHIRAVLVEALFHADHQVSGVPVHD
jgi:DNA-binding transcriptional ArsR family regulator